MLSRHVRVFKELCVSYWHMVGLIRWSFFLASQPATDGKMEGSP